MTINAHTSSRKGVPSNTAAAEQLDAIFRAFPDLLFCLDPEGRIRDYRAGEASVLYLPPEKFLGHTIAEILPPDISDRLERGLRDAVRLGKVVSLDYRLEVREERRWFEANMVPNEHKGVIVIIRDVTHRVRATDQIQRQLRRMSALHVVDAAITASYDLKVTLSVILREVINHLGMDAADVLLFNPQTRMLEYAAGLGFRTRNLQRIPVMLGQGFAGQAAVERRAVSISNLNQHMPGFQPAPFMLQERYSRYHAIPLITKGQVKGVLELYSRTPGEPDEEWVEFLSTLAGQMAVAIDSAALLQELQRSNDELALAYETAIESWAQFIAISGRESREHVFRVVDLSLRLAQSLRVADSELVHYRRGALLHDVGKVSVPEAILNKPGPLDEAEWRIVRNYPILSHKMLASLQHLGPALDIPHYHHERWNGSGYPYGLSGEQIPFAARIVGLVDVYEALQSPRPYRQAWSKEAAQEHIHSQAGILFDPAVTEAFLGLIGSGA